MDRGNGKMDSQKQLVFIGVGVMGEVMVRCLLRQEGMDPKRITVTHRRPERLDDLVQRYGVNVEFSNIQAVREADMVFLCVKPQAMHTVLREIRGHLPPQACLISVAAGVSMDTLMEESQHPAVVRCMPNTPAQLSEGMTVWVATKAVSSTQQQELRQVLQTMGKELQVDEEKFLDMATAISGSGPAYAFLFMEALMDAAVHLGFSREDARMLVVQTLKGSALLVEQSPLHLAELRNMVTSPGGTSAAGLYELEKGRLRTVLSKAVCATYERSSELGR